MGDAAKLADGVLTPPRRTYILDIHGILPTSVTDVGISLRLEFSSLEAGQGPAMEIDQAAKVAELAYAPDLESGARKGLGVRVPPFARIRFPINGNCQVQRR